MAKLINYNDHNDLYWVKLGIECCNLHTQGWFCYDTLQHSFGKTNRYSKCMDKCCDLIRDLQNDLDAILCNTYPLNINEICVNDELITHINDKNKIRDNKILIIDTFYNISSHDIMMGSYQRNYKGQNKLYKKTLTNNDKQCILDFIKNFREFLKYLKNNIDIMIENMHKSYNFIDNSYKINLNNKIRKIINKSEKQCDKMNIINDITVRDRTL